MPKLFASKRTTLVGAAAAAVVMAVLARNCSRVQGTVVTTAAISSLRGAGRGHHGAVGVGIDDGNEEDSYIPTTIDGEVETAAPAIKTTTTFIPTNTQNDPLAFPPAQKQQQKQTAVGIVGSDPSLSILASFAIQKKTGRIVGRRLDRLTLFAPTDSAFSAYDEQDPGYLAVLTTTSSAATATNYGLHLKDFVAFHIVADTVLLATDFPKRRVMTLSNEGIELVRTAADNNNKNKNNGTILTVVTGSPENSPSKVVVADCLTTDGVVHKIDRLLLPFWFSTNLYAILGEYDRVVGEQFSIFRTLIVAAGLDQMLTIARDMTLLAPVNAGFPKGVAAFLLLSENTELLTQVLLYHVIPNNVVNFEILPAAGTSPSSSLLKTLQGDVEAKFSTVLSFNEAISDSFILVKYGIVFQLDQLLLPSVAREALQSCLSVSLPNRALLPSVTPDIFLFSSLFMEYVGSQANVTLGPATPYRAFVPTNIALLKMDTAYLQQLTAPEFELHLMSLVGFHITSYTGELGFTNKTIQMVLGGSIQTAVCDSIICLQTFNVAPSKIVKEPTAPVYGAELYSIDNVLLPEWTTFTLLSYMEGFDDRAFARYSTFRELWIASGMDVLLRYGNELTLLAPQNAGISSQSRDFLLDPDNKPILNQVLSYHLISDIFNYLNVSSLNAAPETSTLPFYVRTFVGEDVSVQYSESDGGRLLFEDVPVVSFALTKTSILYRIESLLIPPSLKDIVPISSPSSLGDFAAAADLFLLPAATSIDLTDGPFAESQIRFTRDAEGTIVFSPPL